MRSAGRSGSTGRSSILTFESAGMKGQDMADRDYDIVIRGGTIVDGSGG